MSVNTNAFLDEGSSLTLLDEEIASTLQLTGPKLPLHLKWTDDMSRHEEDIRVVSVEVSGAAISKKYKMAEVRTVNDLNLPLQSVDKQDLIHKY